MMLSLKSDDNLGIRFVLSTDQSPSTSLTMEDNLQHRKLLANRVAQLANDVLGPDSSSLDNRDTTSNSLPNSKQPEHSCTDSRDMKDGLAVSRVQIHSQLSHYKNEIEDISDGVTHSSGSHINVKESNFSSMLADESPISGDDKFVPDHASNCLIHSMTAPILASSTSTSSSTSECEVFTSPSETQPAQSVPEIWPTLTSLSHHMKRKRDRRKEVLTNGSLRRIVVPKSIAGNDVIRHKAPQTSKLGNQSSPTQDKDKELLLPVAPVSTDHGPGAR